MVAGPSLQPGDTLEVTIGAVAHGGHCVARHEGQVIFVRHALPGERVVVHVTAVGRKGRSMHADAVEVISPAAGRRPPPCPVASRCGGCDWQHAEPALARSLKTEVVRDALLRFAGVELPAAFEVVRLPKPPSAPAIGRQDAPFVLDGPPAPSPPLATPPPPAPALEGLGWRTRGTLNVDSRGGAGFLARRSHEVVVTSVCPQLHPRLAPLDLLDGHLAPGRHEFVAPAAGDPLVFPQGVPPVDWVVERAAGRDWRVAPDGFWQVHPDAADALFEHVARMLAPRSGERLLDLYAGVGLFGIGLAGRVPGLRVTCVEGDRVATEHARSNAGDLDVRIVRSGVERFLAGGAASRPGSRRARGPHAGGALRGYDLIVLDPPRTGAGRSVIEALAASSARAIAYVACDPVALARDVATAQDAGLALTDLVALDLFPTTHHVECVALLRPQRPDAPGGTAR